MIHSSNFEEIQPYVSNTPVPSSGSHKGQNGKVLIIGGSTLFHSAILWAAEAAAHIVDMVHFSSTEENNQVMLHLKELFRSGIVISQKDIPSYIQEDDVVLIGPGMLRTDAVLSLPDSPSWEDILSQEDEGIRSYLMVRYMLKTYRSTRFLLDAGALQMANPEWFKGRKTPVVITPHRKEFERLFEVSLENKSIEELKTLVKEKAKQYECVILLKTITDIASDGTRVECVDGGNAGLTKGGSGDILGGIAASFLTKSDALDALVLASFIVKTAADSIFETSGYWYTMNTLIETIPHIMKKLFIIRV